MVDYRHKADSSPLAWCSRCHHLVAANKVARIMTTVYRVEPDGVYPFGLCADHAAEASLASLERQQVVHDNS
ncbi:MAG: hypothetical protein OWS03_05765 [Alicyclobacillaceae bacterium]|nr:hypothetical protein [Alicyclobacillaceae bacterium]